MLRALPLTLASAVSLILVTGCNDSGGGGSSTPTATDVVLELPVRVTTGSLGVIESTLADFNGDGRLDLAEIDLLDNEVRIALGEGGTTFLAAQALPTSGFPLSLAAGDYDGDGADELAVVSVLDQDVSKYLLTGLNGSMAAFAGANARLQMLELDDETGDFVLIEEVSLVGAVLQIASGNFESTRDALILPSPADRAVILYDLGSLGLMPFAVIPSAGEFNEGVPISAVAVDADGDGRNDLVIGEADYDGNGPGSVAVVLQDEKGGWGEPTYPLVSPEFPLLALIDDVDLDGAADVAAMDVAVGASSVALYVTNTGQLTDYNVYEVGSRATGVAVADFDADGVRELVASRLDSGEMVTLPLVPDGSSIGAPLDVGFVPRGMRVVDLNGDEFPDLASHQATGLTLMAGTPKGLSGTPGYSVPLSSQFLRSADLDGDGFGDVVTLDLFQRELAFLKGDADRSLENQGTVELDPTSSQTPGSFELGDLDGDGDLDLVVALYQADEVRIYENQGTLPFEGPGAAVQVGEGPLGIGIADIDADGILDLVVGNSDSRNVEVLIGDGSLGFSSAGSTGLDVRPLAFDIADIDGDGLVDLALTVDEGDGVAPGFMVLAGNGKKGFDPRASLPLTVGATEIEAVQLDDDPQLELVVNQPGDFSRSIVVANMPTNDLASFGQFSVEVLLPASPELDPATFQVADIDADGRQDILVVTATGRPVLLVNGGGLQFEIGTLPGGVANPTAPYGTRHARFGDIDGDGFDELLMLAPTRPRVWVVDGVDPALVAAGDL